jgi:hypothetical protein
MIEVFDPLLQILVGLIKFQHSYSLGEHVSRHQLHCDIVIRYFFDPFFRSTCLKSLVSRVHGRMDAVID